MKQISNGQGEGIIVLDVNVPQHLWPDQRVLGGRLVWGNTLVRAVDRQEAKLVARLLYSLYLT